MTRKAALLAAPFVLGLTGCQSLGRLPGIDPTDYAYTSYKCNQTQVYPQGVPQVRSSALEAMADLGYTDIACEPVAGAVVIRALTVDGRPARVTVEPRNSMSAMTVKIGLVGDEMVGQALIQRVALNFGALPRTIIPLEKTLSRRIDPQAPRRVAGPPVELLPPPEGVAPEAIPEDGGRVAPTGADSDVEARPIPASNRPRRLRLT